MRVFGYRALHLFLGCYIHPTLPGLVTPTIIIQAKFSNHSHRSGVHGGVRRDQSAIQQDPQERAAILSSLVLMELPPHQRGRRSSHSAARPNPWEWPKNPLIGSDLRKGHPGHQWLDHQSECPQTRTSFNYPHGDQRRGKRRRFPSSQEDRSFDLER